MFTGRHAGARFARRLIVPAALTPAVIGWLLVGGERAGRFDTVFGVAFMVAVSSALLVAGVLWAAYLLHQAEQASQFAAARYAPLVESSTDAIITAGLDDVILSWNPGATRLFGFTEADALGTNTRDMFPRDPSDQSFAVVKQILAGEHTGAYEARRLRKDGSPVDVSISLSPIIGAAGEVVAISAIARDITERVRTDRELQSTREQLQAVVDSSGAALYLAAIEQGQAKLRSLYGSTVALLGYTTRELIEMPASTRLGLLHPEDLNRFNTVDLPHLLAHGRGTGEFRIRHRDGKYRVLSVQSEVRRDADGNPNQLSGVLLDITERKALETQLFQAQKMEAVGQLAGGIAHDFNNSLTVVAGFNDLMLDSFAEDDPRRDDVAEIRKAVESAAQLTQQLLAFSRRQLLQPKVIDLRTVVADISSMLSRVLGEDVKLVTVGAGAAQGGPQGRAQGESPPVLPTVRADPAQLSQVLVNLALNARDAMPRGGTLTIETSVEELDQETLRQNPDATPGTWAILTVRDAGVGMDDATRARIFEPFFTTKERGKGTGLGLAMVYGIVKQSGGFIWASSEPGVGSTFKVCLPIVAEQPEQRGTATATQAAQRGSETIVLVEDEAAVRQLIEGILRKQGYTVHSAASADEGIALAEAFKEPIHLLISDVVMPGASGRVFVEGVRASRPGVRVLYISGYADDAILRHGALPDGTAFLAKPFGREALLGKVRAVLDAPPAPAR